MADQPDKNNQDPRQEIVEKLKRAIPEGTVEEAIQVLTGNAPAVKKGDELRLITNHDENIKLLEWISNERNKRQMEKYPVGTTVYICPVCLRIVRVYTPGTIHTCDVVSCCGQFPNSVIVGEEK